MFLCQISRYVLKQPGIFQKSSYSLTLANLPQIDKKTSAKSARD